MNQDKNGSRFIDMDKVKVCSSPFHYPPSYIVIPEGKIYKHVCPDCGQVQYIHGIEIRC